MERVYNPKEIEQKWQKIWDDEKAVCRDPTIIPNRSIMRW